MRKIIIIFFLSFLITSYVHAEDFYILLQKVETRFAMVVSKQKSVKAMVKAGAIDPPPNWKELSEKHVTDIKVLLKKAKEAYDDRGDKKAIGVLEEIFEILQKKDYQKITALFKKTQFKKTGASYLSNHENKYICKNQNEGDKISFYNLKFGENLAETFCRIIKKLSPENYVFNLYTQHIPMPIDNFDVGVGDFLVESTLHDKHDAKLVAEGLYYNFCSATKSEAVIYGQGYHEWLVNFSNYEVFIDTSLQNVELPNVSPYSMVISPIFIEGLKFHLLLAFTFSPGQLLNDDLSLNENILTLDICKEPYDGSGLKKTYFPFRLSAIQLATSKRIDKNVSVEIYEKILNILSEKYEVAPMSIGSTSYIHPSCDKYGNKNEISRVLVSYCIESDRIFITYSSLQLQKNPSDNSPVVYNEVIDPFLLDYNRMEKLMNKEKQKKLEKNKDKDSSSGL